jgi:flagellar basal-body rod modification protein FlgD
VNLNSIVQQLQAERQQQANGVSAKAVTGKTASGSGSAGDTGDATITADDFLTLLVTELQNQDPTSDTDPNAYVNQLVDVNSLQQLISINSGIGTLDSSIESPSASGSTGAPSGAVSSSDGSSSPSARVSQAQVNTAQASYGAFDPSSLSASNAMTDQLSIAQQLDASNPALNTHNANANPAVPSEWRTTQGVTS